MVPIHPHNIQYLQIVQISQVLSSRVRLGHYENTLVTIQCDLKMFFLRCSHRHMSWQHDTRCIFVWGIDACGSGQQWAIALNLMQDPMHWSKKKIAGTGSGVLLFASEGHEISPTWAKCHQLDFFDGRMFPWSSLVTVHLGKVMTAIPERNAVEWMPAFYAPCELQFQRKKCKRPDKSEGASLLDSPQHFFNVAHACIFSQDDFFLW